LLVLLFENRDATLQIEDELLQLLDVVRAGLRLWESVWAGQGEETGQERAGKNHRYPDFHRPV
jgi:hypothetical protein